MLSVDSSLFKLSESKEVIGDLIRQGTNDLSLPNHLFDSHSFYQHLKAFCKIEKKG